MNEQSGPAQSEWKLFGELWNEICNRTTEPARHPSFVFFFSIAVILFGGLGIWVELFAYCLPDPHPLDPGPSDAIRTAIITFFPVIAGTAAMQMMWAEKAKHFRSAAFFVLAVFLVPALMISSTRVDNGWAIFFGVVMSVISLWVWWIANAKQIDLLDQVNTSAAIGGDDPGVPLPGTTLGFTTTSAPKN